MATLTPLDEDKRTAILKQYRTQFATVPASIISIFAGSPFENIKTRMQSRHFVNALDCVKHTYSQEGYRGFWSGSITPLFNLTCSRLVTFSVYQKTKYALNDVIEKRTGQSPLIDVNVPGTYPTLATCTCFGLAGMAAGLGNSLVSCPFEVAKNAAQTSVLMSGSPFKTSEPSTANTASPKNVGKVNALGAIRLIVKKHGVMGLYAGFQLHAARDVFGTGLYFCVYEATKQFLRSRQGADKSNTMTAIGVAGAICGTTSWLVTYPLDTMKTRVQSRLLGDSSQAAKICVNSAAQSSTFKGIEMMLVRSSIQNCVQMLIFEYVKVMINNKKFSDGTTKRKSLV